ncbi:tRNA 5-carboxymethoxyuridine methyltransferase [Nocardioides aquaticus]|uniref:tRNA 5-carboxymethoxyuridine methyltransferase n=1 Tax=Nocardioides aquaticus TaxID=160826 RepID=A0ABX8EIY6_9ACTN|nr:class I SAM-dependent methyltransferase [Nocardioides aquaticus]QVT78633.1 tRNA 5-carboxymethoxyuridine methyltransferase [Nocardioides aquaticus]
MTARPTRWAAGGSDNDYYAETFAALVAEGEDVEGEARLADALCPRGARVLDAGAGMGRVAAALQQRGHHVLAVEPDAGLVARAQATYPDLPVLPVDVLDVDARMLAAAGAPEAFDLVVAVGNVMVFVAEGTEVAVLRRLHDLLAPGGRVLLGFHPVDGPTTSRDYAPADFVADATAAGLHVDARYGSYELHPPTDSYVVWVLARGTDRA